jgi:hypothetical protein
MKRSTPTGPRYGERMTSPTNPVPATIVVAGPSMLLALACQKCREVYFMREPEAAVKLGMGHAEECGTDKIVIAELVTAAGTGG